MDALPAGRRPAPTQATDDWPFLYLRSPSIQPHYLLALGFVLLFALLAVAGSAAVTRTPLSGFSPHFFVLGIAFMLLETRSLVSFSLLFGTTWLVNALAFFAILASVLVAILVNAQAQDPPLASRSTRCSSSRWRSPSSCRRSSCCSIRPGCATCWPAIVAFSPVFLANLVFTYSFRDTKIADMAFASNLLGAMLGGVIEYLALISGYRFLLVVVAVLYLGAWLFATRTRILADVGAVAGAGRGRLRRRRGSAAGGACRRRRGGRGRPRPRRRRPACLAFLPNVAVGVTRRDAGGAGLPFSCQMSRPGDT